MGEKTLRISDMPMERKETKAEFIAAFKFLSCMFYTAKYILTQVEDSVVNINYRHVIPV